MKLRTQSLVVEAIDQDLAWRKRELTTAMFLAKKGRDIEGPVARRAMAVLAYAHWEGFVKSACRSYLNYLSLQGLKYRDLQPSIVALATRPRLRQIESANRITAHCAVTEFLMSDLDEAAEIPWEDAVTELGNLNSETLEEVALILGINYAPYSTKAKLIDERLVRSRHDIAHGRFLEIDEVTANDIHDLAISLMNAFQSDVLNAITTNSHTRRRSAAPA